MGTYDPKSRRHSPAPGEDAPAAVDAMLGDPAETGETGAVARPAAMSPPTIVAKVEHPETGDDTGDDTAQQVAPVVIDIREDGSAGTGPRVYVETTTATRPHRPRRRWLIAAAVLSVVLVLWAIRRRR
ncbi:MAG: hypothetical protein JJLCMIEE_01189 [Acidimicrobiales bacterium]|nr:MAG: hypothetical protein EDR02_16275 [Actinomycetota bacterium]MBV6508129.1 hypothetical protein [Acidimicrobiales bacterium]RIK03874.1 MAG: hypothetical protein DCC48_15290 [Acidobacteriota bacterium]